MSARVARLACVVVADMVASTGVKNLRGVRDKALAALSSRHLAGTLVYGRYTITAWDEFQNVLTSPAALPRILWDLRLSFRPVDLKIGIGIGEVRGVPGPESRMNEDSSGDAFLRARQALASLERGKKGQKERKYVVRTAIASEDQALDRSVNLAFLLIDTLLEGVSRRQWETLAAYDATGSQEAAAQRLKVSEESTVSRSLRRSHYWQVMDALGELEKMLAERFAQGSARSGRMPIGRQT